MMNSTLFRRSALVLSRRAATRTIPRRSLQTSIIRRDDKHEPPKELSKETPKVNGPPGDLEQHYKSDPVPGETDEMVKFDSVKTMDDLLPPGAAPGTIPTDLEQATGLERFELLGKMQGIDVFDMKPLDSSRTGTLTDPIVVKSFGDEQYCGCTGCPADSHHVHWVTISRDRPIGRCGECGSCYRIEYVGPPDDPHDHHESYRDPPTFADYVQAEYRWDGKTNFDHD